MKTVVWESLTPAQRVETLSRPQAHEVHTHVQEIIRKVRQDGDAALSTLTQLYDQVTLEKFQVTSEEKRQTRSLEPRFQEAIIRAAENIKTFHQPQLPLPYQTLAPGLMCRREFRPIEKVGLYIPGGTAPLVSTLLMLAIPAKIARCKDIILTSPPQKDGTLSPAILFAAEYCGVTDIYKVGGAQAIAALAYGTETLPKVDKIFGPGNIYVTQAKALVAMDPQGAAFDMPAGPSEVLVIANETANPNFIASDLLAQAEHAADAQVILVTPSSLLVEKVRLALAEQLRSLTRHALIEKALETSRMIIAPDLKTCFAIANHYAPEHLILHLEEAETYLPLVQNAGSIFVGPWTPESLGDYASGTNHVLPTNGYARCASGLGVEAFMKSITIQKASAAGLKHIGETVETLAELEGLTAHKNAVTLRLQALSNETIPLDAWEKIS